MLHHISTQVSSSQVICTRLYILACGVPKLNLLFSLPLASRSIFSSSLELSINKHNITEQRSDIQGVSMQNSTSNIHVDHSCLMNKQQISISILCMPQTLPAHESPECVYQVLSVLPNVKLTARNLNMKMTEVNCRMSIVIRQLTFEAFHKEDRCKFTNYNVKSYLPCDIVGCLSYNKTYTSTNHIPIGNEIVAKENYTR